MISRSNPTKIESYWGVPHLRRWNRAVLRDLKIPAHSKQFMAEIGLPSPAREIFGWEFDWDPHLSRFVGNPQMRILGWERGTLPILIDEGRNGCVVWDATEDGYERYLNASIEQFAASLVEIDEFGIESSRTIDDPSHVYDEAAIARRIAALEDVLRRIDVTAVETKESLWSAVIHSMRLELG